MTPLMQIEEDPRSGTSQFKLWGWELLWFYDKDVF